MQKSDLFYRFGNDQTIKKRVTEIASMKTKNLRNKLRQMHYAKIISYGLRWGV